MIKAYLVEHFRHPETGQVLLVKMATLPAINRTVTRALARGDWGESEFLISRCRWPDQPNTSWDIALATTAHLDWGRCRELILYFERTHGQANQTL